MSHATVLVISGRAFSEEIIEEMMYPYWELDLSNDEKAEDSRAVFAVKIPVNELEKYFEEWKVKLEKDITELMIRENDLDEQMELGEKVEKYIVRSIKERIKFNKSLRKYNDSKDWVENYDGYYLNPEKTAYGRYHNPNKKWDWYEIGGRWAGLIKLKDGATGFNGTKSFMFDEEDPYKNGGVDSALKKDITEECIKDLSYMYAVLDMNGWHQKSQLGWFGCSIPSGYCCVIERLNIHEITRHFRYDHFGFHKNWTGLKNKYVDFFIKTLHKHYYREGNDYILKDNLGNGKTGITEELKRCEFFRDMHWSKGFYDRFIKNLPDDARLTLVDYHI